MRDWLKFLLAVGGGAAVALIIALPIVLVDSDSEASDENAQRFPEDDFVKFDEIWDGTLSYTSFSNSFSAVNPDHYICTEGFKIYKTAVTAYKEGGVCKVDGSIEIAGAEFETWYTENKFQSYRMSADEKYILARKNTQKQWRHSYYADYYVFDLTAKAEIKNADIRNYPQAQYASWSPSGHKLVWVSNDKDIYYQTGNFANAANRVTNDGGWCHKNPRILGTVYPDVSEKCIYNGVPDWNYEEEMISSTNTIYWSPDSAHFVFISFDVTDIELLEYSVYPDNRAAASPDESNPDEFEQYPQINTIKYAKALGNIAKTKAYLVEAKDTFVTNSQKELNKVNGGAESLSFDIGVGKTNNQENRYFTRIAWAADASWFAMTWTSRAATQAKTLVCKVDGTCEQSGREDGGVKGQWKSGKYWNDTVWENEDAGNNYGGWVGSFGPFPPVLTETYPDYFNIYSYKVEQDADGEIHPYGLKVKDGFWNVALQAKQTADQHLSGATWLTDSRAERWTVTGLDFYDAANQFIYFTAARSISVGSDRATEQRKRHVFRVAKSGDASTPPTCITCSLDDPKNEQAFGHCGWTSVRRNCDGCAEMMFIASCSGNKVPQSYRSKVGQDFSQDIEWEIMESNSALETSLSNKAYVNTEYGIWENEKYNTLHNYEMYTPKSFDSSGDKKYPLFLEVYAGPEFQKIQQTFKRSWPQVHLPGAYDCITLSVDGRGSAFQGDRFMFSNYKALAQTERVDQTDFVHWFINKGPYAHLIDKTRVSMYGWSYGGYTTTHTMGYGGGEHGPVFTSGVAVAPLADWRYYDAMYAERYMGYEGNENEHLEHHWVNASMIERPIIENDMEMFTKAEYNLIHGTNDDNVHFLSAAQMEKALVTRGIDFDNFYYADEDHSIRSTQTVQKHIYRNIITRIIKSWGFKWNGNGEACNNCYPAASGARGSIRQLRKYIQHVKTNFHIPTLGSGKLFQEDYSTP